MKAGAAILIVAVLLIAGCGSAAAPHISASPQVSPTASSSAAGFSVPTKRFDNPSTGIALRYPSSWRESLASSFCQCPDGRLTFMDPAGDGTRVLLAVQVSVSPGLEDNAATPLPSFQEADAGDLGFARHLTRAAKERILHSGLVRLGGLRLAEVECLDPMRAPLGNMGAHRINLYSAWKTSQGPSGQSLVQITVSAAPAAWRAEKPILMAVLESLRFSTPQRLK